MAINNIIEISELETDKILTEFQSKQKGLSDSEVRERLVRFGFNEIVENADKAAILKFLSQFKNPLIITLFVVSLISYFLGEKLNAVIVIAMAFLSTILSFYQEHRANKNAEKLAAMVKINAHAVRNGKPTEVKMRELVPGDIVDLSAGDMIPADCILLEGKDLYVNQSALNGESFPSKKCSDTTCNHHKAVFDCDNLLFMGSSVVSGTGLAIVAKTGRSTQFGQLSHEVTNIETETAFEKGIKSYTWLMLRFIIILGFFIFFANGIVKHNFIEALLFAVAVAIGLAPEMLPMLVTVNLSKGALDMAKKKIIVKRLDSIQNFGAMDILCTDKTGTLTADDIALIKHCNALGNEDESVLHYAHMNSYYQTGLKNILDKAVLKHDKFIRQGVIKVDEIPYDFSRRIMSVIVNDHGREILISKGAPEEIIKKCVQYEINGEISKLTSAELKILKKKYDNLSSEGFRVLAIAYKLVDSEEHSFSTKDEEELIFKGFAAFLDPPKSTVAETIKKLQKLGIALKILSGDNELVTRKICCEVGLSIDNILRGEQIDKMTEKELKSKVMETNIFVRLSPMQKERIVNALQSKKHIVGFMGDGINDAPALKTADVGISVDNASDIAKETASIILLEKDLSVLCDCVLEGRKVFANVIKYIKMGASSNLGNMISLTGASFFLPFLPMLPAQVLLNNFLYDISQVAIPTDEVDKDYLITPRPWDIQFIKKFMLIIGPISSLFDFATFGAMWFLFHASPELFRTGWFVESLATQTMVVFIIRTSKIPFFESKPSKTLLYSVFAIVLIGAIIPYTFFGKLFSFQPLPALFFLVLIVFVALYLFLTQIVKSAFIKRYGYE